MYIYREREKERDIHIHVAAPEHCSAICHAVGVAIRSGSFWSVSRRAAPRHTVPCMLDAILRYDRLDSRLYSSR